MICALYLPTLIFTGDGYAAAPYINRKDVIQNEINSDIYNKLRKLGNEISSSTGTAAGGSTTQIQFNDSGALGGDSGMTYDKTNDKVSVSSAVIIWVDISSGTIRQIRWPDGTVQVSSPPAAGAGSPGGSTQQIQYNNAGAFAGTSAFTYDGSSVVVNGKGFEVDGGNTYLRERLYLGDDNSFYMEPSEGGETMGFDWQGVKTDSSKIRTGIFLRPPPECWLDNACINEIVIIGRGDGGASTPTAWLDVGWNSFINGFSFHQESSTGGLSYPMTFSLAEHPSATTIGRFRDSIEVQGSTNIANSRNGGYGSVLINRYATTNGEVSADTTPINAMIFALVPISANGIQNSDAVVFTGNGYNSSLNQADWKYFVGVSSQSGISTFTWQNRINSNAYVTKLQVTDESNVIASTFTATLLKGSTIQGLSTGGGGNHAQIIWNDTAIGNYPGFGFNNTYNQISYYSGDISYMTFRSNQVLSQYAGTTGSNNFAVVSGDTGMGGDNDDLRFHSNSQLRAQFLPTSSTLWGPILFTSTATVYMSSNTTPASIGGTIYNVFTTTSNRAATETNLYVSSIPAKSLTTLGDGIRFEAAGTIAATAATDKRIKVKLGATTIFDTGNMAITFASDWTVTGTCYFITNTSQKCKASLATSFATLSGFADYATATEIMTTGNALTLTGNGTNAADVVAETWQVDYIKGSQN